MKKSQNSRDKERGIYLRETVTWEMQEVSVWTIQSEGQLRHVPLPVHELNCDTPWNCLYEHLTTILHTPRSTNKGMTEQGGMQRPDQVLILNLYSTFRCSALFQWTNKQTNCGHKYINVEQKKIANRKLDTVSHEKHLQLHTYSWNMADW